MLSLVEIKQIINELSDQIGTPFDMLPTLADSRNDGTPDIDVNIDNSAYLYIARDRDSVVINRQTSDLDELLYWVFRDVTSRMSSAYIRKVPGSPNERIKLSFNYQLTLLGKLNIKWKERFEAEIEPVLKELPDR